MQINALFLADEASVTNDRLTVKDGLWDGLQANSWPAGHPIQVVVLLAPSEGDIGKDLDASVVVLDPDGKEAGRTNGTVRTGVHREQVPVVLPVRGTFAGPGRYRVSVSVGQAHGQVSFVVRGPSGGVLGDLPGLNR